ncbi:MAG: adenylate/guanylate cyclase domain-containing protein, partial [Armatimonadota bacterium]
MRTHHQKAARQRRLRFPFHLKLTLLLVALVGGVGSFGLVRFHRIAREAALTQFRRQLEAAAVTAASTVDVAEHETLRQPGHRSREAYRRLQRQLARLRHCNRYIMISDLYTMRLQDGQAVFVADSYPAGPCRIDFSNGPPQEPPTIGECYEQPTPEMLVALRQGIVSAESTPNTDEWGTWLSAYAPLRDERGVQVGILGVDASAQTLAGLGRQVHRQALELLLLGAVVIPLAAYLASLQITRPIVKLVAMMNAISTGHYDRPLQIDGGDEFGVMARACQDMTASLRHREQLKHALTRHLSAPVARRVFENPQARELGGERVQAAILVADIRRFTTLTRDLSPEETVRTLNEYLQVAVEVVAAHGGMVDKFLGDGLMAIFGIPPEADHELRAMECAQALQSAIGALNVRRGRQGQLLLAMGIGVASGEVVAGHVGTSDRLEFTVIGVAVNEAHRLQAFAEGGEVVLS